MGNSSGWNFIQIVLEVWGRLVKFKEKVSVWALVFAILVGVAEFTTLLTDWDLPKRIVIAITAVVAFHFLEALALVALEVLEAMGEEPS